jgi:hypothetical protein
MVHFLTPLIDPFLMLSLPRIHNKVSDPSGETGPFVVPHLRRIIPESNQAPALKRIIRSGAHKAPY